MYKIKKFLEKVLTQYFKKLMFSDRYLPFCVGVGFPDSTVSGKCEPEKRKNENREA